jgi:hypothetical protein
VFEFIMGPSFNPHHNSILCTGYLSQAQAQQPAAGRGGGGRGAGGDENSRGRGTGMITGGRGLGGMQQCTLPDHPLRAGCTAVVVMVEEGDTSTTNNK